MALLWFDKCTYEKCNKWLKKKNLNVFLLRLGIGKCAYFLPPLFNIVSLVIAVRQEKETKDILFGKEEEAKLFIQLLRGHTAKDSNKSM
jgi:hypothetical protein